MSNFRCRDVIVYLLLFIPIGIFLIKKNERLYLTHRDIDFAPENRRFTHLKTYRSFGTMCEKLVSFHILFCQRKLCLYVFNFFRLLYQLEFGILNILEFQIESSCFTTLVLKRLE